MPVRVRRAFAARVEPAMRIANVVPEETPATGAAREVVAEYSSPALVNHGERSYLWSAALGELAGMAYDRELLFVASMVHDLGLVLAFDNHLAPFEDAGGDVGWVFAAGAGWPQESRARVKEIVVRHMWDEVDPAFDAEGHLLCEGTGLDISGREPDTVSSASKVICARCTSNPATIAIGASSKAPALPPARVSRAERRRP
jgi:hypothetical protein